MYLEDSKAANCLVISVQLSFAVEDLSITSYLLQFIYYNCRLSDCIVTWLRERAKRKLRETKRTSQKLKRFIATASSYLF